MEGLGVLVDETTPEPSREALASEMLSKAASCASPWTRKYDEACQLYDACIGQFAGEDLFSLRVVAQARRGKGEVKLRQGDLGAARPMLEGMGAEFAVSHDALVAEQGAMAMLALGKELMRLKRCGDAIAVLESADALYSTNLKPGVHTTTSYVLFHLADSYFGEARFDDALSVYDRVLTRLLTSAARSLADDIADALSRKARVLVKLDQDEEAAVLRSDMLDRYGATEGCEDVVSEARLSLAGALVRLGRSDDAVGQLKTVIEMAKAILPTLPPGASDEIMYQRWLWSQRVTDAQKKIDAVRSPPASDDPSS